MDGLVPPKSRGLLAFLVRTARWAILGIIGLAILSIFWISPSNGFPTAQANAAMQTSHTLGICFNQYANDHGGHYPTGTSSTEVFQKLIDGNYVSDPAIFYLNAPSKIRPTSSQLKPENVSWDVTIPLDQSSPADIPLIFCTGYRIEYKAGGQAIPIPNKPRVSFRLSGTAVTYLGLSSRFFTRGQVQADGTILNFISPDANLGTTHYVQLTPDGHLSP